MSSSAAAAAPPPNAQVPTGSRKTTSVDGELSSEGTREVEVPADDVEDVSDLTPRNWLYHWMSCILQWVLGPLFALSCNLPGAWSVIVCHA